METDANPPGLAESIECCARILRRMRDRADPALDNLIVDVERFHARLEAQLREARAILPDRP